MRRRPPRSTPRAARVCALVAAVIALTGLGAPAPAAAATSCPSGAVLDVVAHEDDDLLFQSPDLLHAIQTGTCVRTVFVTAGDANSGSSYWSSRERGSRAAYAQMAGVSNLWSQSDAGVAGHPMPLLTLTNRPTVSLVFMRLPDGFPNGSGGSLYGYQSLQKLYLGSISTITADDASSSYTKPALVSALAALMTSFTPGVVRTQDYVGTFGDGDHSDHHATAYLTRLAHQQYTAPHVLVAYQGYGTSARPADVLEPDLTAKENAFLTYAQYDPYTCQTLTSCQSSVVGPWLSRQYVLATETGGGSPPSTGSNVAGLASATASSQNTSTGQLAAKAVDGVAAGWPGDYTKEWATVGGHAGSWLSLTWSTPQTISRVLLYDRPNSDDRVTAGSLVLSDGTTIPFGTLDNAGAPLTVSFPARSTTSLRVNITAVSATTLNTGLCEVGVYTPS